MMGVPLQVEPDRQLSDSDHPRVRRLARQSYALNCPAQFSHALGDPGLQNRTELYRVGLGLIALQRAALGNSGAPSGLLEHPGNRPKAPRSGNSITALPY